MYTTLTETPPGDEHSREGRRLIVSHKAASDCHFLGAHQLTRRRERFRGHLKPLDRHCASTPRIPILLWARRHGYR